MNGEVKFFVKIQKYCFFFLGGVRSGIGGRGGVRVNVNGEVKFFENSERNFFFFFFFFLGGGGGGGSG